MQILIRPGMVHEADAVWQVFTQAVHQLTGQEYSKAQQNAWAPLDRTAEPFEKCLQQDRSWVLCLEGEVRGIATLTDARELDLFYLHPEAVGQGFASRLMRCLLRDAGPGRITSYVSLTARVFFENHGFVIKERLRHVRAGESLENFRMVRDDETTMATDLDRNGAVKNVENGFPERAVRRVLG